MKAFLASSTALLAFGACASTSAPQPQTFAEPYYADGVMRTYLVVRDSMLYAAPRPEAPRTGRLLKGEILVAAYAPVAEEWMVADLENGERVYLFGNPLFPQD